MRKFVPPVVAALVLATVSAGAQPSGAVLVSATPSGEAGDGASYGPVLSADGSTMTFATATTNLYPGGTDDIRQVVVADLDSGDLTLASRTPDGQPGDAGASSAGESHGLSLSGDGRFVAFLSNATDLVPGDTNGTADAFLFDATTGQVARISTGPNGEQLPGPTSSIELTADGGIAAFTTEGADLAGAGAEQEVVVKDLSTGATEVASRFSDGTVDTGVVVASADVSHDGRYVTFTTSSAASPTDTNDERDVYRRDRDTATLVPMSVGSDGTAVGGVTATTDLDAAGNRLVFGSNRPVVPDFFDGIHHTYVHDLAAEVTMPVDVGSDGTPAPRGGSNARISGDGTRVVFNSQDGLTGDTNERTDVFLRDLAAGQTTAITEEPVEGAFGTLDHTGDTIGFQITIEETFTSQVYVLRGGPPPPPPVACVGGDGDPTTTERIGEATAARAAIALSCGLFSDADGGDQDRPVAEWVVLSRNDAFPDSLAGAPLTSGGPMLFTPQSALDKATAEEIERVLAPGGTVYLLGGEVALSAAVAEAVEGLGYDVRRLAGPSRVETSLVVANEVLRLNPAADEVLVARAFNAAGNETSGWADSVTGGGYGAAAQVPIVVTSTESLHPAVEEWLAAHDPLDVVLVGGEAALSADVAGAVGDARRVSGPDRFATNAAILDELVASLGDDLREGPRLATIVNGEHPLGWAFGLAAAARSAAVGAPVVLAGNDATVREPLRPFVSACGDPEVDVLVIGAASILSENIVDDLADLDGQSCS